MSDFRKDLYDNYHSRFKSKITSVISDREKKKLFATYDYSYYPFMKKHNKSSSILEAGCGPGLMIEYLHAKGFEEISGIDISPEQTAIAESTGAKIFTGDILEFLKDKQDKFDIIIALDFVEHFKRNELKDLFTLIYNALKKGGTLILRTPNGEGLFPGRIIYGDLTHYTIFTPSSLKQALYYAGFENTEFSETGPLAKNLPGILRLFVWKLIKLFLNFIRLAERFQTQKIWTEDFICAARK